MKSGESSDNNRAFWKRFDAAAKIFLWTFFSSPLSNLILKLCGKGGFGPYKACLNWEKWAIINFSIQTNADISSNFLADSDKFSRSDNLILIWRKNGERRRVRNQNKSESENHSKVQFRVTSFIAKEKYLQLFLEFKGYAQDARKVDFSFWWPALRPKRLGDNGTPFHQGSWLDVLNFALFSASQQQSIQKSVASLGFWITKIGHIGKNKKEVVLRKNDDF